MTTDDKIQLRTSRTDYVSATNPKIYQFGSSGRSVIPQMHKHFLNDEATEEFKAII